MQKVFQNGRTEHGVLRRKEDDSPGARSTRRLPRRRSLSATPVVETQGKLGNAILAVWRSQDLLVQDKRRHQDKRRPGPGLYLRRSRTPPRKQLLAAARFGQSMACSGCCGGHNHGRAGHTRSRRAFCVRRCEKDQAQSSNFRTDGTVAIAPRLADPNRSFSPAAVQRGSTLELSGTGTFSQKTLRQRSRPSINCHTRASATSNHHDVVHQDLPPSRRLLRFHRPSAGDGWA